LTPEESAAQAGALMMMDQRMTQDTQLAPLYSVKEKYSLYSSVFELLGFQTHKQFLASPDDPEAQQRVAQMQQQAQAATAQAQQQTQAQFMLMKQQADAQTLRATSDAGAKQVKSMLDARDQDHTEEKDDDDYRLDVRKQDWDETTDIAEYQLEKTQRRPASI
jgi:hypothetical protein